MLKHLELEANGLADVEDSSFDRDNRRLPDVTGDEGMRLVDVRDGQHPGKVSS
jgi:hypothetical protein